MEDTKKRCLCSSHLCQWSRIEAQSQHRDRIVPVEKALAIGVVRGVGKRLCGSRGVEGIDVRGTELGVSIRRSRLHQDCSDLGGEGGLQGREGGAVR